jgi:hypothetical protein
MQRIFRAASLALALSLGLANGVAAGPSAGAAFTQTNATTVAGIGPGETVSIDIDVTGIVDAKNAVVILQVSDPAAFNMGSMTVTVGGALSGMNVLGAGTLVSGTTDQLRQGAADLFGTKSGDGTISVAITTSDAFTADTEASLTVLGVWFGVDASVLTSASPDPEVHDLFGAADVGAGLQINPPVSDPTLVASTATDASVDFSPVGSGAVADGSAGEVALAAIFSDATGAAAAGQSITWTVSNSGAESIYILGTTATEVAAGASVTITATSGADGATGLTLDSEGDKFAGSTSASITAATSATNSEGASLSLSVAYSVTWDVPVPAELASFAGEVVGEQGVSLQWAAASQTNNLGWEVYRSVDNQLFERVSPLISGEGTTDQFRQYSFLDEDVPGTDVVYYYLRQVDLNGTASRSDVIEVALAATGVFEQSLPLTTALNQNYPNPFNPETTIQFDLAVESSVTLRVFDITGQVVRTLVQGTMPAGSYVQLWDGRNGNGARVGSGLYFYELKAGSFTSMKKMTLLQ